jgi:hypothetical protein
MINLLSLFYEKNIYSDCHGLQPPCSFTGAWRALASLARKECWTCTILKVRKGL